jgi:methionyl-tRNA synthetase
VRGYEQKITDQLERADLRDAFRTIFELSSFANKTFQDGEPWKKRKEDPQAAEALIRDLCYVVRDLAILNEPYLPAAAAKIASFFELTLGKDLTWAELGKTKGLHKVTKPEVLFAKLEDERIRELREKYSGSQAERKSEEKKMEEPVKAEAPKKEPNPEELIEKFCTTLDLRAAKIVSAEKHPNADKLFVITLDIGGEARVICSGLVGLYTAEELTGKNIIVVYNLKGRKMRGIESKGMLLAASDMLGPVDADGKPTERVEVLDAGDTPSGTRIGIEGGVLQDPPEMIKIDDFLAVPIRVTDHKVEVCGRSLLSGDIPVRTGRISDGEVH